MLCFFCSQVSVLCSGWKFQAVRLTKDPFQRLQQKLSFQTSFYFHLFSLKLFRLWIFCRKSLSPKHPKLSGEVRIRETVDFSRKKMTESSSPWRPFVLTPRFLPSTVTRLLSTTMMLFKAKLFLEKFRTFSPLQKASNDKKSFLSKLTPCLFQLTF